ncbi:hypothetical protein ACTXT7_010931 [Hymenolepis weldensis]
MNASSRYGRRANQRSRTRRYHREAQMSFMGHPMYSCFVLYPAIYVQTSVIPETESCSLASFLSTTPVCAKLVQDTGGPRMIVVGMEIYKHFINPHTQ